MLKRSNAFYSRIHITFVNRPGEVAAGSDVDSTTEFWSWRDDFDHLASSIVVLRHPSSPIIADLSRWAMMSNDEWCRATMDDARWTKSPTPKHGPGNHVATYNHRTLGTGLWTVLIKQVLLANVTKIPCTTQSHMSTRKKTTRYTIQYTRCAYERQGNDPTTE